MASAIRQFWALLALLGLSAMIGCSGASRNTSYTSQTPTFGQPLRTSGSPASSGYYVQAGPQTCRIECFPLEATNPVRTQHVLVATVFDEKGQPRRDRRVEWMLEGVGEIVEVDETGVYPDRGRKIDNHYAVSYTSFFEHRISRNNGNPNDDFVIQPGQTWCVITSAVEGDTHVIAYSPGVPNWDRHKVFATKHWVDAEWVFPKSAVNRFGTTHVFTTKVYRHSDGQPLAGYRVRYKILDGPPAVFLPGRTQTEDTITGLEGAANVTIAQVAPAAGVNRIGIEIIRPPESGNGVGIVIARGETRKEWVAPRVTLTKTAPPMAAVGQEITYVLTATNYGQVETKTVTIRDYLPDNAEYVRSDPPASKEQGQLIWTLGELPPNQPCSVQVVFKSKGVGTITNRATLTTDEGQTDEKQVTTQITSPQLKLSVTGPATAVKNVPMTYQLTVNNPGTGPVTNLLLKSQFDPGLEHESKANPIELPAGTLGAGETRTYSLVLTPRQTGTLVTRVMARADGDLTDSKEHPVTVQEAKLSVNQSGPPWRYAGRPATFNITVTNPGDTDISNVVVREQLPAELTFKGADKGGQFNSGAVTWSLGNLKAHESATVQLTASCDRLTQAAVAVATVTADPGLQAENRATIKVMGLPAFRVEVVDLVDPVPLGDKTTYKIDVTNQGTLAGDQVRIVAFVPPEMTFLSATGPSKFKIEDNGQKIVFDPVDAVGPRQNLTYQVEVRADKEGNAVFKVQMSAATLSRPVEEQEPTTIFKPGQARATGSPAAAAPAPPPLASPASTASPEPPPPARPTSPAVPASPPATASGGGSLPLPPPTGPGTGNPMPMNPSPSPMPGLDPPPAPTPGPSSGPVTPAPSNGPPSLPPPDPTPASTPSPGAGRTPTGDPRPAMPPLPPL